MAYSSLPTVVGGEPVLSSWGNLVDSNLDDLNASKVAKAGDTLTGDLTVGAGNPATQSSRRTVRGGRGDGPPGRIQGNVVTLYRGNTPPAAPSPTATSR